VNIGSLLFCCGANFKVQIMEGGGTGGQGMFAPAKDDLNKYKKICNIGCQRFMTLAHVELRYVVIG
jgi:hypothetical protein